MKKVLLLALTLFASLTAHAASYSPTPLSLAPATYEPMSFEPPPTMVTFTWSYTPGTVVVCTSTITTNCVNSFLLSEPVTAFSASIPAVSGTTAYSYNLTPLPAGGTYTYSLVASETTSSGAILSAAITTQVVVPSAPAPPTNLKSVVQ